MALKIYNKSTGSQSPDEINRRLNNKIKLIQGRMNELNLKDFLNKKKNRLNNDDDENDDEDDDDDDSVIKNDKKLVNGFHIAPSPSRLKAGLAAMNKSKYN